MGAHCSDPGFSRAMPRVSPFLHFQAHLVHIFLVCSEITPHCWKKNTAERRGRRPIPNTRYSLCTNPRARGLGSPLSQKTMAPAAMSPVSFRVPPAAQPQPNPLPFPVTHRGEQAPQFFWPQGLIADPS